MALTQKNCVFYFVVGVVVAEGGEGWQDQLFFSIISEAKKMKLPLESGWVVYGPENGYNFPYPRLLRYNVAMTGSIYLLFFYFILFFF